MSFVVREIKVVLRREGQVREISQLPLIWNLEEQIHSLWQYLLWTSIRSLNLPVCLPGQVSLATNMPDGLS